MSALQLPISTRTLLSYHRRFSLLPLTAAATAAATTTAATTTATFSLLKFRAHQTLAAAAAAAATTTTTARRNVVEIVEQRGLNESITSESLRSNNSPLKVYCGFDPTAESLHLGNLIGIVVLSWFKKCGHTPVTVLGGATGRVGDPSGKLSERPELDEDFLEKNTRDADVVRFLKVLTFLEIEAIEDIEREMKWPGYVPNSAQRRLVEELTRFVHGEEGFEEAVKATEALRPAAETKLDWKMIEGITQDVPSCSLTNDEVVNRDIVDLSVLAGLLESKSAARRMLKQGGLYLNNSRVDGEGRKIEDADIIDGKVLLLSAGKKNNMVVRIS